MSLKIDNLKATANNIQILNGIDLEIKPGEIHALMGLNGSGKSTLANVILGHPDYQVNEGKILWDGEELLDLPPHERALKGLFLAFQSPPEIPGVSVGNYLKRLMALHRERSGYRSIMDYINRTSEELKFLGIHDEFIGRYLNEGFSGGEKKRMEILQMLLLKPRFALLDEIDSGLDIDALKQVSKGVNKLRGENFSALIITHYQRILNYINPDFVHIILKGRIVLSGDKELVEHLEEKGYDWIKEKYGLNIEEEKILQTGAVG